MQWKFHIQLEMMFLYINIYIYEANKQDLYEQNYADALNPVCV
jgi:hypothetical protein